ncbi:MAG: DsrE family protein [Desulfobacteraceae bacterium]|nr:DsrE family protein [Desulfobacteraceae bacterium]
MSTETKKLLIIATFAEENPDKATLPFVVGNTALAMGNEVTIMLQSSGVFLATKGYANHVQAAGFPPLAELMATYKEAEGKLLVCSPCLQARKIGAEQLVEGAQIVAGATLIAELMESAKALTY